MCVGDVRRPTRRKGIQSLLQRRAVSTGSSVESWFSGFYCNVVCQVNLASVPGLCEDHVFFILYCAPPSQSGGLEMT